jgi:hypothetical protein
MCTNAAAQAENLLKAAEPTLVGLLSFLNQTNTPAGKAVVTAYDAAIAALGNWKSGTTAQNVLQLLGDFTTVFSQLAASLPIPAPVVILVDLISGAVSAVIGILEANSPAPPAPASEGVITPQVKAAAQTLYAHTKGAEAEAMVYALTGYKPSFWDKARAVLGDTHVAANAYKSQWNKAVTAGSFPASLKTV